MPRRSRAMPRVSEKVVQAQITQLLRSIGGAVYVLGTVRRRGDYPGTCQSPGLPDLLAFLPPPSSGPGLPGSALEMLVAVEVKAAGGRLRPEQAAFRAHALAAGMTHLVGDLDVVIAWLVCRGFLRSSSVPSYRQPKEETTR